MDVVKRLERDGRIQIRETRVGGALEGLEEEVSAGEARKSKWGSKPQTVEPGLQAMYPMGMGYPMMGGPMGYPAAMPGMMAPPPAAQPAPAPAAPAAMSAVPTEESVSAPIPPAARPAPAPKRENAEAKNYLDAGVSCYEEGRYEDALAYLEHAVSSAPDSWRAEQYLGLTLYALDRDDEAMVHFDRLLDLNPSLEMREWVEQLRSAV
jgi:hypothetical protein